MVAPAVFAFEWKMRAFHAFCRHHCRENAGTPRLPGGNGLPHGKVPGPYLLENIVRHRGHGDGVRHLIAREPHQFCRRSGRSDTGKSRAIKSGLLDIIRKPQVKFITEHDGSEEISPAGLCILGGRQDRHDHIAGVAATAAGPVMDIIHFHKACRCGVGESRHVGRCLDAGADYGGACGIGQARRHIAGYAAGLAEKSTHERAQRITDAYLGRMHRFGGQGLEFETTGILGQALLDAVQCSGFAGNVELFKRFVHDTLQYIGGNAVASSPHTRAGQAWVIFTSSPTTVKL